MVARLGIASNLDLFLEEAATLESVKDLREELGAEENQDRLLIRVFELARQSVDIRYENEWDAALGIYGWMLDSKNLQLGQIAARAIAQAPACDWAFQVAERIVRDEQRPVESRAKTVADSSVGSYWVMEPKFSTNEVFLTFRYSLEMDGVGRITDTANSVEFNSENDINGEFALSLADVGFDLKNKHATGREIDGAGLRAA